MRVWSWDKAENLGLEISDKLPILRSEKHLSQKEAAEQLGISVAALSYYETGARVPNLETLYRLCAFYNVSLDYMVGLTSNKEPQRNYDEVAKLTEIGFMPDTLDYFYENHSFVTFLNEFANHDDFKLLQELFSFKDSKVFSNLEKDHMQRLLHDLFAGIIESLYMPTGSPILEKSLEYRLDATRYMIKQYREEEEKRTKEIEEGIL